MSARRVVSGALLPGVMAGALLSIALAPGAALAQDVERHVRPGGPPLPQGYFDRIRLQPDFFTIDRGWSARVDVTAPRASALGGTLNVLVVQVLFGDSPEPHIEAAEVRRVLFDGPTQHGTLTDFYRELSRGALTMTGFVTPWVRTAITRAEVLGDGYGLGMKARTGTFLHQAMAAVDELIDLGQFDNDGPDGIPNSGDDDGFVDIVAFQFIERAAACGGDGIWPHRGRIRGWEGESGAGAFVSRARTPSGQPIRADSYIIQSTVDCDGGPMNLSVIAHELGHVFGLPDFYHAADGILPSQRRWVLGCWTLMAAGAWGCGDGASWPTATRPSHMGAYEKIVLGWIPYTQVPAETYDREYTLAPAQTTGQVLMVNIGLQEFLLLEYRPAVGFDAELAAGGVLIYHADVGRRLYPAPGEPRLYHISLKEADGDDALLRTALEGGNRGVAGDVWGIDARTRFSAVTTPALIDNRGLRTTVTFHSIVVDGGVARVRITTARIPKVVDGLTPRAATALTAFTHELRAIGGALPYRWSVLDGRLPQGLALTEGEETLQLSGTPLEAGRFTATLQLTDAFGTTVTQPIELSVGAIALDADRLTAPFMRSGGAPLTADEEAFLDLGGNRNGRYDIGDLRRYLRTHGP
jgi:M6 family metalloprotease-like protein